jgi:hypothetical protein
MAAKALGHVQKAHTFYHQKQGNSGGSASGGSGTQRITNPPKAESPIWRDLKPYRGDVKCNGKDGKDRQYYQWDHTHNDIEVFDSRMKHVGSMNPTTGSIYKPSKGYKLGE